MKGGIFKGLKVTLFISLSVLFLFLAFRKVDSETVLQQIKEARFSWLILSFLFSLLAFFSRARRWVLMIRPLGYNPGLMNTYHSLLTGYLVNFALPRVGEVTRCVALGRKEKIPVDRLIGTVIAERAFDLLSMFIILLVMLLLRNDLLGDFLSEYIFTPLGDKFSKLFNIYPILIWSMVALFVLAVAAIWIYRKHLSGFPVIGKITRLVAGVMNGLRAFVRIDRKGEFLFHTIFIWLNYALMTWVIVFMIPATSHLGFADGIFLLVIGSLGMAAPVQGGIGAFHWIVSRGLFAVYGVAIEDGLVYATLSHESQLLLIAFLGTFSFFRIFGKRTKDAVTVITENLNDGKEE